MKLFLKKLKKAILNPKLILVVLLNQESIARLFPDKLYLKFKYRLTMGKKLNLKTPQTFNEKLQWLKLYNINPEYTKMVDKYAVRKYIADTIGVEYLIPLLGVWDSFDEIDFDKLPNQFVLKCTHDSGGLVVCRDKSKLDIKKAKRKITRSFRRNYFWTNREWPYKNVKPRIIAEQYMEDKKSLTPEEGLTDYKFFCFDGKPEFAYVSSGLENHSTARISFSTLDWKKAPFSRNDYTPFDTLPKRPKNFKKMIELSEFLSTGKKFLRVDFYEIDEKIYFGELTFYPASGMVPFDPDEWDYKLGELIKL